MSPPDLIEFVGLPGAGKSTLASHLGDTLRDSGVTVREPTADYARRSQLARYATRLWYSIRHSATNPGVALQSANLVFSPPRRSWTGSVRGFCNWLHLADIYTRTARADVSLLDQGLFQAIWSIQFMAGEKPLGAFETALDTLLAPPTDVLVVLVDIDSHTMSRRLSSRPADDPHPVDLDDPRSVDRALAIFRDVQRLVDQRACSMTTVDAITVSNTSDGNIDGKVAAIRSAI